MAVTHPFVSAVADGSDATLVRPSNWNADHTVADGSFVAAKLSLTTTDRILGRSTAGAGNGEEITCTAAGRALIDDPTAAAQRTTLDVQASLLMASNTVAVSPGDGSTLFFGAGGGGTTVALANSFYFENACVIKAVRLNVVVAGTLGTTEQATASFRKNNTADTTISAVVQYDAVGPTRFDNTALNIAMAAGDFGEFKIVFPTFVTNPTTVYHVWQITYQ